MPDSFDRTPKEIIQLAEQLTDLQKEAVLIYEPIVKAIIASRSTDVSHIEHTLDGLLGFAGSEEGLRLFKTLCRHYWQIDPAETVSYIHGYRDMWDTE